MSNSTVSTRYKVIKLINKKVDSAHNLDLNKTPKSSKNRKDIKSGNY
ncbi:hypothetical protein [Flavobacterium sp. AJR]|nr:hypothetical protein [Flavobacterium sp. AJR]